MQFATPLQTAQEGFDSFKLSTFESTDS